MLCLKILRVKLKLMAQIPQKLTLRKSIYLTYYHTISESFSLAKFPFEIFAWDLTHEYK